VPAGSNVLHSNARRARQTSAFTTMGVVNGKGHSKNVSISTDILRRVFDNLTKSVPYISVKQSSSCARSTLPLWEPACHMGSHTKLPATRCVAQW